METAIPAWKIRAKFAALPLSRKGLWNGEERRARPRGDAEAWAQRPAGRGETGAALVQVYGHTDYNYNNDQLKFEPWKP